MQRNLLNLKKQRLENMVCFIDNLLDNKTTGEIIMSKQLKHAMSNDAFNKQKLEYAKEAKEKWGVTDSYKQSQKSMAKYSKQDIVDLNQQQAKIYQELAALMPLGVEDSQVQEKVHQARMFITNNWYDCSPNQFSALGKMYVADERFKLNIDQYAEGLSEFFNGAIKVYVNNL